MTRILQEKKATAINLLTIFTIFTFSLQVVAIILLSYQGLLIRNEANSKKPLTLVQLVDGKVAPVAEPLQRNPEAIRQFVSKTMAAMFNWSGTLPAATIEDVTNPKADVGILIRTPQGTTKRVATSSWVASFGLSEDFRRGFLEQIADITPPDIFTNNFTNNQKQSLSAQFSIQRVYPPQQIAPGRWRVGMVANIVQIRNSDNKKLLIPFNKDFLVRAVDYVEHPLSKSMTAIQKAVYGIRSQKLEIYEMSDLCLIDPYDSSSEGSSNRCVNTPNSSNFTR